MEKPKNRSLPEQKGPQPAAARGPKDETTTVKGDNRKNEEDDPKNQRGRKKHRIYV